jgi:hypothetical protein
MIRHPVIQTLKCLAISNGNAAELGINARSFRWTVKRRRRNVQELGTGPDKAKSSVLENDSSTDDNLRHR